VLNSAAFVALHYGPTTKWRLSGGGGGVTVIPSPETEAVIPPPPVKVTLLVLPTALKGVNSTVTVCA
jgi:hypothetical protein